jgi:class 3 adenylate cyclase
MDVAGVTPWCPRPSTCGQLSFVNCPPSTREWSLLSCAILRGVRARHSGTRKIAAILIADIVEYSRIARVDEDRILARLRTLRSALIVPAIPGHNERVVKRVGDGRVIEFRSVVAAVRCAIERNAGLPEDRRWVTESLTTDLSRTRGMLVIGRNTAFTFKRKAVDLKQDGRELNVGYILEEASTSAAIGCA